MFVSVSLKKAGYSSWLVLVALAVTGCIDGTNDYTASSSVGRAAAAIPSASSSSNSMASAVPGTNAVPVIVGAPESTATIGVKYSFQPVATDANGGTLAFTITNKPAWATFNTATGSLTGTPTAAATLSNIVISVSDGAATASLKAFSITVVGAASGTLTLNWLTPSVNTDGSALTDLAGYTIHYGTDASDLSSAITLTSAADTRYTFQGLTVGKTYYFAVASVNSAGITSDLSSVASTTI